jgi:hypothetical protein
MVEHHTVALYKEYLAAWQFRLAEALFDQTGQNWDMPCSKEYLASRQGFEVLNITLPPEKMTEKKQTKNVVEF